MLVVALIDSIDLLQRFDVSTFDNVVELRSNKVQIVLLGYFLGKLLHRASCLDASRGVNR